MNAMLRCGGRIRWRRAGRRRGRRRRRGAGGGGRGAVSGSLAAVQVSRHEEGIRQQGRTRNTTAGETHEPGSCRHVDYLPPLPHLPESPGPRLLEFPPQGSASQPSDQGRICLDVQYDTGLLELACRLAADPQTACLEPTSDNRRQEPSPRVSCTPAGACRPSQHPQTAARPAGSCSLRKRMLRSWRRAAAAAAGWHHHLQNRAVDRNRRQIGHQADRPEPNPTHSVLRSDAEFAEEVRGDVASCL